MFIRFLFLCMLFTFINSLMIKEWDTFKSNIFLDFPDITKDLNMDNQFFRLELFKSYENDVIIENKLTRNYDSLRWAVLSIPQMYFIKLQDLKKNSFGFMFDCQIFPEKYKSIIEDLIEEKYNISISSIYYNERQILDFNPSRIQCQTVFDSDGEHIEIRGIGLQETNTLSIFFVAPEKSKKRILFENEIKKTNPNIEIKCDYTWSAGKVLRIQKFNLTSKQIENLNISEKLFGKYEQVYVTRNQLSQLAREIYESCNIILDYVISFEIFENIFMNEFIGQINNETFTNVDFDQAISNLSIYNVNGEVRINELKSEMGKIFKIKKKYTSEIIEFDKNEYTNFTLKNELIKGSVFGCLESFWTFKLIHLLKNYKHYKPFSSSFFVECENENIEWYRSEDLILPKRIKAVKINRWSFDKKNFTFNRLIQIYKESYYKRNFTFYRPSIRIDKKIEISRNSSIISLAVLPDGNLISGHKDHTIVIWNQTNLSEIRSFSLNESFSIINVLANGYLAIGSYDGSIKILNPENGLIIGKLLGHSKTVIALTVLQNGYLASGSLDFKIKIWDPNNQRLIRTISGHISFVSSLTILLNGDLVSGSADKTIKIWDLEDGSLKRTLKDNNGTILSLKVLPNGNLVSAAEDRTIKIWNPNDGSLIKTFINQIKSNRNLGSFYGVSTYHTTLVDDFENDENDLEYEIDDKHRKKRQIEAKSDHKDSILAMNILPNGYIASGTNDGEVKIWNPIDGSLRFSFEPHNSFIKALAVLSDGNLVTSSSDGTIKIWSLKF